MGGWITCPEVIPDEGATCTHVVNVDLGEVVEMRIVNTNNMNDPHRTYHTVHLHGYEFYVTHVGFPVLENGKINVGTENVAKGITCVDEKCVSHDWNETELESSRVKSPFIRRNTILMASQGFTIIRFRADNPGVWPFHCHLAIHNVDGMAMFINVVDRKHNRPYSIIPNGVGTCSHQNLKIDNQKDYPWEVSKKSEYSRDFTKRSSNQKYSSSSSV